MAVDTIEFTTGPATLPDVGELSYNGVVFSPLFATQVSGIMVKDDANRTVKYMEYTIKADGYVTLPAGESTTANVMKTLAERLSAQAGSLVYVGRGFDIIVNRGAIAGVATISDVAWGPVPEILDFQPLGAGRSAKIVWQVKVRIPEIKKNAGDNPFSIPMLQFNYDSNVSYGEDGFSTLNISGVLEIPLTRSAQNIRTLRNTADDLRTVLDTRIMSGVNLNQFKTIKRNFNLSKDKRTLSWDFQFDEIPYMQTPPDVTIARGTFTFRPATTGRGLANWLCSLRATYIVRPDRPRRTAWLVFLALVRERMMQSLKDFSDLKVDNKDNDSPPDKNKVIHVVNFLRAATNSNNFDFLLNVYRSQNKHVANNKRLITLDFNGEEGLYSDSKTVTFSITWRVVCQFRHILAASGMWRKVPERPPFVGPQAQAPTFWALSMKDVQGSQSWLVNRADASKDIIVDFGQS